MKKSSIIGDIAFRVGTVEDQAFVYSSWLKSFLETSLFTRGVPRQLAFQNHRRIVSAILNKATVLIATPQGEDEQILGYVVAENLGSVAVIHYSYIKAAYRRFGVARALLDIAKEAFHKDEKLPMLSSHMTEMGRHLKGSGLIYNPYLLMSGDYIETEAHQASADNSSRKASGRFFLVS